jgi:hypothetical protein
LGSYSGLQWLKLQYPSGSSQSESDDLADTFFSLVVPQHIDSLTDLSCAAGYESRWSFGPHNVDVISQLSRLTSLEMSVNAEDVIDVEPGRNAVVRAQIQIAPHLGLRADSVHPQTLLLHTTTRLLALRNLAVVSADADRNRGARCGRPRMHHMGAVHKYMKAAVDAFHTRVPSAAVLLVGYLWYELVPVPTGEHLNSTPSDSPANGSQWAVPTAAERFVYKEFLHPHISWQRLRYLWEDCE